MTFSKLHISAITQTLPPPFAYQTIIDLSWNEEVLDVAFALEYINRDEISQDEIEYEGFTSNDDFKWQGQMDKTWWDVSENLIGKTSIRKSSKYDGNDPMHIELTVDSPGQPAVLKGLPLEYNMWEFHVQELIQAVYEASGKERPLEIKILKKNGNETSELTIFASFAKRSAVLKTTGHKTSETSLTWEKLKSYLKIIYQPDFIEEKSINTLPKKDGIYISADNLTWFQIGVAIIEPSKKSQTIRRIEDLINELIK